MAGKNGNRPEICGVFFTKDKTVAMDDFCLLEITVPADKKAEDIQGAMRGVKPFIPSAEYIKKIHLTGESVMGIKHVDDNHAEFLVDGNIMSMPCIAGQYPDYEKIIPNGAPVAEFRVNAQYLENVLNVLGKLGNTHEVVLKFYGERRPMVIEAGNDKQRGKALVMGIVKLD